MENYKETGKEWPDWIEKLPTLVKEKLKRRRFNCTAGDKAMELDDYIQECILYFLTTLDGRKEEIKSPEAFIKVSAFRYAVSICQSSKLKYSTVPLEEWQEQGMSSERMIEPCDLPIIRQQVSYLMRSLSSGQREALIEVFWEDASLKDLITKCPNAHNHYYRGLAKLRQSERVLRKLLN